jgi:hypothetical protein
MIAADTSTWIAHFDRSLTVAALPQTLIPSKR